MIKRYGRYKGVNDCPDYTLYDSQDPMVDEVLEESIRQEDNPSQKAVSSFFLI